MKPFRERNPVVIGVIGIAVIALMMLGAFRADRLPIIGSGDTYHADFAEIGALKAGNEVRVAGVSIGKVEGIELRGNKVRVYLQDQQPQPSSAPSTGADTGWRTLLGAGVPRPDPQGPGAAIQGRHHPVEAHDRPPYDVVQAFSELSKTDRRDQHPEPVSHRAKTPCSPTSRPARLRSSGGSHQGGLRDLFVATWPLR